MHQTLGRGLKTPQATPSSGILHYSLMTLDAPNEMSGMLINGYKLFTQGTFNELIKVLANSLPAFHFFLWN